MDKEKNIIFEFLKSLRVALTNTSVYFNEHPLYAKAVSECKKSLDKVLSHSAPLAIGITQHTLVIADEHLEDMQVTRSIAEFFHLRKVKSLTFELGVTTVEMGAFLSSANLPPRDITVRGGLSHMLEHKMVDNIIASGLSYSQLLESGGAEYKDLWLYLLREGLGDGDARQVKELADNLPKALKRMSSDEILNDSDIGSAIEDFFKYLKANDSERYIRCSQDLAAAMLTIGDSDNKSNFNNIKGIIETLPPEKIAQILLSQINSNENLDKFSFDIFSQLISKDQHTKVASLLGERLKGDESLSKDLSLMMKLRDLFSLPSEDFVSETYRQNLSLLFGSVSLGEGFSFDRDNIAVHFRFLLLVIFFLDSDSETIERSLENALAELAIAIEKNDLSYIKKFVEILSLKIESESSDQDLVKNLKKKISSFAEDIIFSDSIKSNKTWISQLITVSGNDINYYLDKIFNEKKISSTVLTFFFKFFPNGLDSFYQAIDVYTDDISFITKIMSSLERIDSPVSAGVLKYLHFKGNSYIKLEALKRMAQMTVSDTEFLFSILQGRDSFQKKEALRIIIKNSRLQEKAASMMLKVMNPFGIRTKVILSNMDIVKEVPFEGAETYLLALSKYRFFWNQPIRKMAKSILESIPVKVFQRQVKENKN
jgi:hypothetical protein